MESFSELIKARRSMRKFTEEELTQEQVVTLMKAALMAPTSKRSNAWQFIVVDEKDKLKELSYCKEQASQFIADAALAVVVVADPLASDVWIEDASIASIYLQLQAEDMGLGSCWVQVRERFTASGMPSASMCTRCWIFLCSCRCLVLLLSAIRGWSASLSTKTICSGKRYISISTEESNSECSKSKQ